MIGYNTLRFFLEDILTIDEFEIEIDEDYELTIPSLFGYLNINFPEHWHKYELVSIKFILVDRAIDITFDRSNYDEDEPHAAFNL